MINLYHDAICVFVCVCVKRVCERERERKRERRERERKTEDREYIKKMMTIQTILEYTMHVTYN